MVRIVSSSYNAPLPLTEWHLGTHPDWSWTALTDPKTRRLQELDLPAGEVTVEILPREDGAMLDQLELKPASAPHPR
jgi:hypothetical protein